MAIDITIAQAIVDFIEAREAEFRSQSTLDWYRWALKRLGERFGNNPVNEITPKQMRQLINSNRQQDIRYSSGVRPSQEGGYSDESLRGYDRAFRAFWSWCSDEYHLDSNPMARIDSPKEKEQLPKDISWTHFVALLMSLINRNDPGSIRDCAIILFLADTGVRAAGLRKLTLENVDLDKRRAIISGEKDGKIRAVPFSKITAQALFKWLQIRPTEAKTLFCGFYGRHYGKSFHESALNQMLERRAEQAGIEGRVNPHSFRHAAARRFLQNGGDLESVRKLLGHAKITTTSRYYLTDTDDGLRDRNDRFGALSKLLDESWLSDENDDDDSEVSVTTPIVSD